MRFETVQKILGDHARNFSFIDPNPIAAASIGQVHRGVVAKDGRVVAIKIRRPAARDEILADSAIITAAANAWASPRVRMATLEFCGSLAEESDFLAESRRAREFAESVQYDDFLVVPSVLPHLCRDDVLVMQFVESVGVLDHAATLSPRRRTALARKLMTAFMTQLLEGDYIHGDPHLGNMGMTADGRRLVLYDFGCVVAMDDDFQTLLKDLVLCMLLDDAEGALSSIRAMKDDMEIIDTAEAEKYVALYFSYAQSLDIAPFAAASKQTRTAPIQFSSRITRLVRAFAMLEGTCVSIDPSFTYNDLASDFLPMFADRRFVTYRAMADARKLFFL
jgi:ubiquinone biosynthesis protein